MLANKWTQGFSDSLDQKLGAHHPKEYRINSSANPSTRRSCCGGWKQPRRHLRHREKVSYQTNLRTRLGLWTRPQFGCQKLFIDSDCYAEPDWIEKMLPHFHSNPEVAAVTGRTNLWNKDSAVARFLACVGGRMAMPTEHVYMEIAPTMNLALRHRVVDEVGGFDETLIRCEDTDLTYKISKSHKILYEPNAVVWFKGSPTLGVASRKCVRHFSGVGQLFAKHGFKASFARFNLPFRGFLLIAAIVSLFLLPWYVPTVLFLLLFSEFVYKTAKLYGKFRDNCVVYYVAFFTFWSLASLAIFYGLLLGFRNRAKRRLSMAALEP